MINNSLTQLNEIGQQLNNSCSLSSNYYIAADLVDSSNQGVFTLEEFHLQTQFPAVSISPKVVSCIWSKRRDGIHFLKYGGATVSRYSNFTKVERGISQT